MKNKILIIPDIHNKWRRAENIIRDELPDKVIFTGDYFDDFGDNARVARETALWLKDSLRKPERIHLLGNHDIPYMALVNELVRCSGFLMSKATAIFDVMNGDDWERLKLYHIENDILFTHAGLAENVYRAQNKPKQPLDTFMRESAENALQRLWAGDMHWMLAAGRARGGYAHSGGITWNDFDDEHEPIPNLTQVCGHTPRVYPEWKKKSLCLDTHLRHYGVLIDDKIEVREFPSYF